MTTGASEADHALLHQHKGHLEDFCTRLLVPYTAALALRRGPKHRKEFNDPVWGTLVLYPLEIAVLDSPLLQRLRRVRQLGVAHWVYPGATHSRLEHSLGVVHQIQSLIESINAHSSAEGEEFISQRLARLLRLTALCHDIGHGVMSHVSEKAVRATDADQQLEGTFVDQLGIERASLGEIAAYYMIGSPAFQDMLRAAQEATDDHALPADAVASMQKAVVGLPISDHIPLLHELIAGPFDADKLDYMPRDAQMSGIPVVTDVERLIQKVRAVRVAEADLPPDVARRVRAGLATYVITGVALSGARTLDELMLGRALLFDKVYRHQKVRAAEAMVASILFRVADLIGVTPILAPYRLTDDALLDMDEETVSRAAGRELSDAERARATVATDIAERLRDRRLFVRAFAFAQKMPLDPYRTDDRQESGLVTLMRTVRNPRERAALVSRICDDVRTITRALEEDDVLAAIPGGDLAPYICIDPPEVPPSPSDAARAYLIGEDRKITQFRDAFAETRGWADAYLSTRDVGYVFAPDELSPYVFLAAEKIVYDMFGVRVPPSMLSYAKQDAATLDTLKVRLSAAGYYPSPDLRPPPPRLAKADVLPAVDDLVGRLGGYSGLAPGGSLGKATVDRKRILDWVGQFEEDDLVDAALRVVRQVVLVGRPETNSALDTFMTRHPEFRGASLCPLGEPKDSSSVITYFGGDLADKHDLHVTSLSDALTRAAPVVFVDDFIGSGNQAAGIVQTWLGERPSVALHEDRQTLAPEQAQALRDHTVGFVFAAGLETGVLALERTTRDAGIGATVYVHRTDLPSALDDGVFESEGQGRSFRDRCERIGRALLTDAASGHDTGWAAERALGYGNHALLVVSTYNTPTQTLTCLWKGGEVSGNRWTPLFPRRPKR